MGQLHSGIPQGKIWVRSDVSPFAVLGGDIVYQHGSRPCVDYPYCSFWDLVSTIAMCTGMYIKSSFSLSLPLLPSPLLPTHAQTLILRSLRRTLNLKKQQGPKA